MNQNAPDYSEDEKRVLKDNIKSNAWLIKIGSTVAVILAIVAASFLRIFALDNNRTGMRAAYIVLYFVLLAGNTCFVLGFRGFRKENIYFKTASIMENLSIPLLAFTALLIYFGNQEEGTLGSLRYGIFTYVVCAAWQTVSIAVTATGYGKMLKEQNKAYLCNYLKRLAILFAGVTFFLIMIIISFELYGVIIFGIAIAVCVLIASYQIKNLFEDIEEENIYIYSISVKGRDWLLGALVFAVSMAAACVLILK